jgi:hypothetical protein
MKQFVTAAQEADTPEGEETPLEFDVDGVLCKAYRPGDGQLAVFMASTAKHASEHEAVAGIINFFASVLDDDSNNYIVNRLLDRKDSFGLAQVQSILQWMVGEWTARPTQQPSGSTASPESIGTGSTQSTPASI